MKRGGGSHVTIAAIETVIETSEEPAIIIGNVGRQTFFLRNSIRKTLLRCVRVVSFGHGENPILGRWLIGEFIKREPDLPRHRGSFSSIQRFACRGQPNAPTSSTIEVFSRGLENRVTPKSRLTLEPTILGLPTSKRLTRRMTLRPDGSVPFSLAVTAGGMPNEFVTEPIRHPSGLTCRSCRSADAPASASFDREFFQHALTIGPIFSGD